MVVPEYAKRSPPAARQNAGMSRLSSPSDCIAVIKPWKASELKSVMQSALAVAANDAMQRKVRDWARNFMLE